MTRLREMSIQCKSVLTRSKIPSLDYAVNPYVGCQHGCIYCYATFMKRFLNIKDEWGTFVGIKENAPAVLAREAARRRGGAVCFGTVCDAYQPIEERTRLSRACLEAFVGHDSFEVGVLTKSDLILRDADVLSKLARPDVGFSITCLDEGLARKLEPGAPSPERRLEAMSGLARRGIDVWGFFGPVLPTFSDSEEDIAFILREMEGAGASRVLVDSLNLYPKVWAGFRAFLLKESPDREDELLAIRSDPEAYRSALTDRVAAASRSLGIEVETCF